MTNIRVDKGGVIATSDAVGTAIDRANQDQGDTSIHTKTGMITFAFYAGGLDYSFGSNFDITNDIFYPIGCVLAMCNSDGAAPHQYRFPLQFMPEYIAKQKNLLESLVRLRAAQVGPTWPFRANQATPSGPDHLPIRKIFYDANRQVGRNRYAWKENVAEFSEYWLSAGNFVRYTSAGGDGAKGNGTNDAAAIAKGVMYRLSRQFYLEFAGLDTSITYQWNQADVDAYNQSPDNQTL